MLRHPPPPSVRSLVEVKLRGVLSRRVHRIASLEGGVLTLRGKEANHPIPTISVCVLDAQIEARRKVLSIMVRVSIHRIKLYLPNERKFDTWLRSLRSSSRWKVTNFYELGDPIAAGQFATVHSASERVSADLVAVKLVHKPQFADCNPRVLQFIKREAYVCRIVDHPSVARVHDVFETPDALFIVMDHFPYTLRDVVSTHMLLKECDAAAILKSVLNGVKYLHEHKIVHRDIKPDNILCKHAAPPYNVAICDFGLSNFIDPTARKAAVRSSNPSQARRRIMDQSASAAVLDATRFLQVANGDHHHNNNHHRRFSEDFVDSPASEDISDSESGDSHDDIQDPSSPLSAYRNHTQRAPSRGESSSHQSQSFSFGAFARLRMRRSPSDARAPRVKHTKSNGGNTAAGSYGSTVSGHSGYTTVEPSSEQTDGGGRVRGRLRGGSGGLGFGRNRAPHASGRTSNGYEPSSTTSTRRTRQRTDDNMSRDMDAEGMGNYENEEKSFAPNMDKFTLTSAIGTPCYVAPEIVERERYGRPVDVWGCGLLLYLMLSGKLPFNGRDSSETLEMIRQCQLENMEQGTWSDVSFGARSLVRGMLQKDPRRRITVEQALAHAWLYEAPNRTRKMSNNNTNK